MAAAGNQHSENQFLCPICLDVFTDPVSTPCGHNFCMECIVLYWDMWESCQCPLCKEVFDPRPWLRINTLLSEMAAGFRQEAPVKVCSSSSSISSCSSSEQQAAKRGDVFCDLCSGTKAKALKSCLVCLVSYCETHLEPHLSVSGLKKHHLVDPVDNLEDRMCPVHHKLLELFCQTDQTCVCVLCSILEHNGHKFAPLRDEYDRKKVELRRTDTEMQQMIWKRHMKIEEIREQLQESEAAADRQEAEGVELFTAVKECVERGLKELMERMEEEGKKRKKQAAGLIRDLEEEITELTERSSEVQQLSCSEDHLHLLLGISSLNAALPIKDWTEVTFRPPSCEGTVVRAVAQLEKSVSVKMQKFLGLAELKRLRQYAVDVTLDPDTANPHLVVSHDGKEVYGGDGRRNVPDNPERFRCSCVIGKQIVSSGKLYFEVQVKGKTMWTLGLVKESINRKGNVTLSPQAGFWLFWLRDGKYMAFDDPEVRLSLRSGPERVGMFVDYEGGLLSFYDVDAMALIYSFTGCIFTEKLLLFFDPQDSKGGRNAAPMIICPVNPTV